MKGKRFGPPPKKGPQPQGFSKGGSRNATSQEQAFFKESFNRHFLSTPAGSNNLRIFSPAHINTIMGKVVQDFEGRGGRRGPSTNMNAGYVAKESETGVNTKKVTGLDTKKLTGMKEGGMGCPHREMGVKSDIKGISDIQITGKKFIGVK